MPLQAANFVDLLLHRNFNDLLAYRAPTSTNTSASTPTSPTTPIDGPLSSLPPMLQRLHTPEVLVRPAFIVHITGCDICTSERKRYVLFHFSVACGTEHWIVHKRYSELRDLHNKLKREILPPGQYLLQFPPRKYFGNQFSPEFLERRRGQLNAYVQRVLDIPLLRALPTVREFFADRTPLSLFGDEMIRVRQFETSPRPKISSMRKALETALKDTTSNPGGKSSKIPVRSSVGRRITLAANGQTRSVASKKKKAKVTTLESFVLLKVVGQGSYGKVLVARHKESQKLYAIKAISKREIKKRPHEVQRIMAERLVLKNSISHPFLIGLRFSFQSKTKLYFCLDYINGGELFFHLQRERRFDENRTRFYAAEITSALEYLHKMGIVYRDLKPENCLLDSSGHVKIVDFGLAKDISKSRQKKTYTFCGTPEYLAPEVLKQQGYSFSVDWYCLGALVHEMLIGLPPFYAAEHSKMFQQIMHEKLTLPTHMRPVTKDFLTKTLEKNPELRLGSGKKGAEDIKSHPFFECIDWDLLYQCGYEPPFVPEVAGALDFRNFDPCFVGAPISQSLLKEAGELPQGSQKMLKSPEDFEGFDETFAGFTYEPNTDEILNTAVESELL